ncbi:sulfatase-like hydrolase/transferase [Maribacter polysiphoniae]|uniref:Phosphoglycerate mutase n=1 Tax=Maribacter polysiphoniae TaxID=429344 RepID=A0A316EPL8_9FLAO|nr:alkaline phosphatase family protein [Maribacter polysiphoniae]MBD1259408.1 sulfatase-like hydrolase/transferase [Maribacter polysiphoniae]PWK24970.1 phosphoglycerate mutase [Maribacter polysiphoniae]
MKNKLVFAYLFLQLGLLGLHAQKDNTKVVLITLDGFRWQELFTGADASLISNKTYVHDTTGLKTKFWRETAEQRREALLPFVWTQIVDQGQIHGNRALGSKVDLTNTMWFSFPGYNEILTGKADDIRITSNKKINNPNTTFLEIANNDGRYKGKVAAFGSWDVFPFIINEERSGVPVNAGFELAKGDDLTEREQFLNELQPSVPSPWSSVRLDAFTHHYAMEEMKKNHPELLYIAYGETDDFAHDGDYEAYLNSAHTTDAFIKKVWEFTQQDPFYKDNTLFIVTTDHGRGTMPLKTWKSHGDEINGSGSVWMILFGKGVSDKGEVAHEEQLFSNQIAPTILKTLDLKVPTGDMPGKVLKLN